MEAVEVNLSMRRSLRMGIRFVTSLRIKKKHMTKGTLYQIHQQFEAWKQNGNVALIWCNRDKMNQFYDQNKEHINALVKQIDKLHEKYFVIKDNKIQQTPKGQPMFKHSLSPNDFEAEQDALFNSEVSSIIMMAKV